jgi:tetratricopeptide (TPR) repeat protein
MARKKFAIIAISGNEEKWVKQWCNSVVKANPDKVIINLTKYDDNSEQLFKENIPENKLVFLKFPWQKNFSEARNHTLDAVPDEMDYAFFIDLDEELTQESYSVLEQVLNDDRVYGQQLIITIYNHVNTESMIASLFYPRMFPWKDKQGNLLKPRFENEVHNQLVYPGIEEFEEALRPNISLIHYGYALNKEAMAEKHARSEELLNNQLAANPDDFFAHLNLAQLLRAKGDIEGTIKHAEKVISLVGFRVKQGEPRYTHAYIMAKEQLATCYIHLKKSELVISNSKDVLDIKPDHLDSIMNTGIGYLLTKGLKEARFWFNRYLFVRSKYDETRDMTNLILNHLNSSFIALYHLGSISYIEDDIVSAKNYFKQSYDIDQKYADTFIRYIHCLRILEDQKTLMQEVSSFVVSNNDKAYQVYEYFGDIALEDCAVENAKFNYYQALHMAPEGEQARIEFKFAGITSVFGPVSENYFKTNDAMNAMKKRIN